MHSMMLQAKAHSLKRIKDITMKSGSDNLLFRTWFPATLKRTYLLFLTKLAAAFKVTRQIELQVTDDNLTLTKDLNQAAA